MSKDITSMTAEEIWAAAGDMSINEAIRSYGSAYNAAREAVDFVVDGQGIEGDEDFSVQTRITRKVEEYLLNSD